MKQRKNDKGKTAKLIWRISEAAPLGEYVRPEQDAESRPDAEPVAGQSPAEIPERGWHHSSHDLVQGVDMSEEPLDTLPDDLFDQFIKKVP
jgi:hypothetical protein